MNKLSLLLFIFCLSLGKLYAQDEYYQVIDPIFEHIDLNRVPKGTLENYGYSFIKLSNYGGQVLHDSNKVAMPQFWYTLGAMQAGKVNAQYSLPNQLNVQANFEQVLADSTIQVAVAHYHYAQIRPDASSLGLLWASGGKLYENRNAAQSPYQLRDLVLACPTYPVVEAGTRKLVFKSDLYLSNTGKTVSSLAVDAGAGWQSTTWNSPINLNLTASDKALVLRFRISYTDGTQVLSHAPILVKASSNPEPKVYTVRDVMQNFPAVDSQLEDRGFQSVANTAESFAFQIGNLFDPIDDASATATITIAWGGNRARILDKPLIVLEGFDAWQLLTPGNPGQNFDYDDFIDNIDDPLPNFNLNDSLRRAGYDLIFVDWRDGTTAIQRNAYLVQRLLEWVNLNKVPDVNTGQRNENVLIGISMGGLVGRYALRDIELRQHLPPHEVRLFVSYDSPHQGANVPLSYQAMVIHLNGRSLIADQSPDIRRGASVLRSPAAQQMLIYQMRYTFQGLNLSRNLEAYTPFLRQSFMQEIANMGYPTQSRNIAISNGSECGSSQSIAAYQRILAMSGRGGAPTEVTDWLNVAFFNLYFWTGAAFGPVGAVVGFIAGVSSINNADISINFDLNAMPAQEVRRIYLGEILIKKKVFFGLIEQNITVT